MLSANLAAAKEIYLPAIETGMGEFLDRQAREGLAHSAEMTRYQLASGGKRLRALIPCLVYSVLGQDPVRAVPLGSALEMIHNATLVHDDLQDGDTVRRGMPTVWKKYNEAQAINCGDSMFQWGMQLLLEMDLAPALLPGMARRMIRAVTEVIEGQAQEFLLKDKDVPTVAGYLDVARGKTAALFAACFALALQSLGKSPALCAAVDQAGLKLGLMFQMQDDLLDLYGEKARERRATDIAEGKISILVAQLCESASPGDRDRALLILRLPREKTGDAEIAEVLALFDRYGIRDAVLRRIHALSAEIAQLSWRNDEPTVHTLMMEMGQLFLEPIRHLSAHSA